MGSSNLFDPKKTDVLDAKERKIWQNPEEILGAIEIKPAFVVADIGAGSGFFALPLSKKVAKVYAVDVQLEMLKYLEKKIRGFGIENIESFLARQNEIPLTSRSVDLLLSINTLHEFDDKKRMISEMARVLRDGGKAVISDWKKKNTLFGPPIAIRLSKEQAIDMFKEDFSPLKEEDLQYHYLLVFKKK